MAGEYTRCPHCECKVKISEVEAEDGFCPECGQLVMESVFGKMFENLEEAEDGSDMDRDYNEENDNEDDEYMGDDIMQPDILDELNNEDDFPLDDDEGDEEGPSSSGKRRRGGSSFGGRSSSRRKKK